MAFVPLCRMSRIVSTKIGIGQVVSAWLRLAPRLAAELALAIYGAVWLDGGHFSSVSVYVAKLPHPQSRSGRPGL